MRWAMPDLTDLDVFYGELTVHRAVVYARLPRPVGGSERWSLAGTVRGPRCLHAQTLPSTARLVDRGPGTTLLAQAVLPDPCCWSPDLPAIYDLQVQLLHNGEVVASERRELGLRRLGVRGRDLFLDGKRWVLRGVSTASTTARLPREWHEHLSGLVAASPSDELLAEAAQWGALTIVEIDASQESAESQLRGLARCPAIALAIIRGVLPGSFQKQLFPNLLLAQPLGAGDQPTIQPWADLTVVAADNLDAFARTVRPLSIPVVAERRFTAPLPLAEARAACDTLQRNLAPLGQFAGYVV